MKNKRTNIVIIIFGIAFFLLFVGVILYELLPLVSFDSVSYLWRELFITLIFFLSLIFFGIIPIVKYGIKEFMLKVMHWTNNGIPLFLRFIPYLGVIGVFIIVYIIPLFFLKDIILIGLDIHFQKVENITGFVVKDVNHKYYDSNDYTYETREICIIPDGKNEDQEECVSFNHLLGDWNYKGEKVIITRWKYSKKFITIRNAIS